MVELINDTKLPEKPQYPNIGASEGIDLDVLKGLREEWLNEFDWEKEQTYLNTFNHSTVTIEGLTIHFVHKVSQDPDAIPLLLTHGWPGSFMEFLPVIDPLTQMAKTSTGKPVSFNVVVPSLPGIAFSTSAPGNWTLEDTARVFSTLMTDVLGYKTFAAHGTSNGAVLTFSLYDKFNTTTRAAHFPLLPFYSSTPEEIAALEIELSPLEQFEHERAMNWTFNGTSYSSVQILRPNTISLALYDKPVGQLAWMGEKWIDWADVRAGESPSVLTHNEILRSISLYYLTDSFMPSVYIYAQEPQFPYIEGIYRRARTDAPMLVSYFKYVIGFWPEDVLRMMGNLVSYRNHEFGGFFAGLENPPDLVDDLREIRDHWSG
ncbi:MAG: hypothetical protein Q9184_007794 [Pyrenodesmia sp. 2 TL-2023]